MTFIKEDGKGFGAAHAADTAFMNRLEFGEMMKEFTMKRLSGCQG
jgi:hypothetical protein